MLSSFGKITNIPIPRFREKTDSMNLESLNVFKEKKGKFMKLVEQMHLLGISQRRIKLLANTCFGISLSNHRIGAIYKEFAEKEDININSQPITDDFIYLLIDGIWEKTKGYG